MMSPTPTVETNGRAFLRLISGTKLNENMPRTESSRSPREVNDYDAVYLFSMECQQFLLEIHNKTRAVPLQAYDEENRNVDAIVNQALSALDKNQASDCKSEDELQEEAFGFIRHCGPDIALENTSRGTKSYREVKDGQYLSDDRGEAIRKLATAGRSENDRNPDITIRLSLEDDIDVLSPPTAQPNLNLESARLHPWRVVAYLELKLECRSLNYCRNQCFEYCENLLRISPGRTSAFCLLTNYNAVQLVACCIDFDSGEEECYYCMCASDRSEVRKALTSFLRAPLFMLGFVSGVNTFLRAHSMTIVSALGRGSTSAVLEVAIRGRDGSFALKISTDIDALVNEDRILRRIRDYCNRLPNAKKVLQLFPISSLYQEHCFLLIEPVRNFQNLPKITVGNMMQLWDALQYAHRAGFVHRDIRWPNIAHVRNDLFLMDWSSANDFLGTFQSPAGSRTTASVTVLSGIHAAAGTNNPGGYQCHPSDEAISVIYLAMQSLPALEAVRQIYKDVNRARSTWDACVRYVTSRSANTNVPIIANAIAALSANPAPAENICTTHIRRAVEVILSRDVVNSLKKQEQKERESYAQYKKPKLK